MHYFESSTRWKRDSIIALLLEAGRIAMDLKQQLTHELKEDQSLVTEADRRVEALLCRELERPEEDVFLIGEETITGREPDYVARALAGTSYIVDPIDGTAPYAHGLPWWGVSVGLMERGRLTDGAVYMPEIHGGEILISDGASVLEGAGGARDARNWRWRELPPRHRDYSPTEIVAISQIQAKRACTDLVNPVQTLGTAVVAIAAVLQGRMLAYMGDVKIWDVAGCIPLSLRHDLSVSHLNLSPVTPIGVEVDGTHYELDPEHPFTWGVKGGLLVCPADTETRLRRAFRM